jgi:hypothetical protein
MFWVRTQTIYTQFNVSSEERESHQPQVVRASHTNSIILVSDWARTPNLLRWTLGDERSTIVPLALSNIVSDIPYLSEGGYKTLTTVEMLFLCVKHQQF